MAGASAFRVVIVGGGYAGFDLARLLDRHIDVVLIEPREAFVHNVGAIRATVEPDLVASLIFPYDQLLKRGQVVRGRVETIESRTVILTDGRRLEADAIVVATGSHYLAPFKPQGDNAADFAREMLLANSQIRAAVRVVIVGAGAVGVELAGEIKAVHPEKAVALVSDQPRLFPMYRAELHDRLVKELGALGVTLHLGQKASGLRTTDKLHDGEILLTDGTCLAGLIVPAIGTRIADSPAHVLPGAEQQPNGQLRVDRWLRPSALDHVFAIGDLAATGEGMTVVSTTRQSPWLAGTLRKLAKGETLERLPAYRPWKVQPILLPLGAKKGVSILPLGKGLIVGDGLTSTIKGKNLFIPRYNKEFGR